MSDNMDYLIGKLFAEFYMVYSAYTVYKRVFQMSSIMGYFFLLILLVIFGVRNITVLKFMIAKLGTIIVLVSLVFIVYFMSFILGYASLNIIAEYIIKTSFVCIPFFVLGFYIQSTSMVYQALYHYSKYIVLIGTGIILDQTSSYVMTLGYHLLLPALIYLNEYFCKKKAVDFLFAVYTMGLILFFTSRGPILIISIFLLIRILIFKGNYFFKILIFSMVSGVMIFWDAIREFLLQCLEVFGIYSRTFMLLLNNIQYLSGRDEIYAKTLDLIRMNPVLGYGPASDIDLMGGYPHNIALEIIYDYGVIFGLFILLFYFFFVCRFFVLTKQRESGLLFLCIGLLPLFLSESYLIYSEFWFFLGIVIKENMTRRVSN